MIYTVVTPLEPGGIDSSWFHRELADARAVALNAGSQVAFAKVVPLTPAEYVDMNAIWLRMAVNGEHRA